MNITSGGSYTYFNKKIKNYILKNYKNPSILDIGAGQGKYGKMFRNHAKKIDAVEVHEESIIRFNLEDIYDKVFNMNVINFDTIEKYDIIIFGDVLEHLSVEDAQMVLKRLYNKSKEIIIIVPYMFHQDGVDGNPYEEHLQPDLTHDIFMERYDGFYRKYQSNQSGFYIKGYPKKYKVGAYAICKNEVDFINRFVEKHIEADQLVVLDTGSTDGTWERLQELSEKNNNLTIKQESIIPWSFNRAKNAAKNLLDEEIDIAVSIDLDEYFNEGWSEALKRNYTDELISYCHFEENGARGFKKRIHKNTVDVIWYYNVHESLGSLEKEPLKMTHEDIIYGITLYHTPKVSDKSYFELLQQRQRLDFNKNDMFCYTMLGWEYEKKKDYETALDYYRFAKTIKETNLEKHGFLEWINEAIPRVERLIRKRDNNDYKICVYAITKNEEKFAKQWIDNMSEADYVVVMDTGSTDNTVNILKENGAIVEQKIIKPWRFDHARTESLKLIPEDADICVCTDLDELFEPGWAEVLRDEWEPDIDLMRYLYSWSHDADGNSLIEIWYNKIHSNTDEWYWNMPVHEVITSKRGGDLKEKFAPTTLHLHHYPDETKSRGQYLGLMKTAWEENNNDFMQGYYYGRELMYHEKYQEAISQLKDVLALREPSYKDAHFAAAYGFMGNCYKALGDSFNAELSFIKAVDMVVGVREPMINLTVFYYEQQRWHSLIDSGERALLIEKINGEWYENSAFYREIPHDYLSIAYYNIGLFDKSLEHIDKCLEFKPNEQRYIDNKTRILKMMEEDSND